MAVSVRRLAVSAPIRLIRTARGIKTGEAAAKTNKTPKKMYQPMAFPSRPILAKEESETAAGGGGSVEVPFESQQPQCEDGEGEAGGGADGPVDQAGGQSSAGFGGRAGVAAVWSAGGGDGGACDFVVPSASLAVEEGGGGCEEEDGYSGEGDEQGEVKGGPSGGCAGPAGGLSAGGVDGLDAGEFLADGSSEGGGCQGFVEEEGHQEQAGGGQVDEEHESQGADTVWTIVSSAFVVAAEEAGPHHEVFQQRVEDCDAYVVCGSVSSRRDVGADAVQQVCFLGGSVDRIMKCDGNLDLSGGYVKGRCSACYVFVAPYDIMNDAEAFVEMGFGESPVFDDSYGTREGSDGFNGFGGRCAGEGYKTNHTVFNLRACKVFRIPFSDIVDQIAERALPGVLLNCLFKRYAFLFC